MKVEVAVLDSPSLIVITVSVDVKQHNNNTNERTNERKNERTHTSSEPRNCVKVEVAALGTSPQSLIVRTAFVDVKQHYEDINERTNERTHASSELTSCVKVEVDVLGSPSLIVLMVSVDVKQH